MLPHVDWHIEACNLMKPLNISANQRYFLSAGEDNLMKVLKMNADSSSIVVVKNCYQHISSVKTFLVLDTNNSNETIIISAGGRSQMCINKVTIDCGGHVQLKEVFNFMLFSTDSERKRKGIAQQVNYDAETRFMCMDLEETVCGKTLYVGCSDGFVRIFTITCDEQNNCYNITAKDEFYYGRCILNLKLLTVSECETVLLTMSTDGLINFWDARKLSKGSMPFYALQHHNSGVNCFDVLQRANTYILASGGDDQQISVSYFSIGSMRVNLVETKSTNSLHSAQITAIKIKDEKHLVASSVDQTVTVVNLNDLSLSNRLFSCIADIKGLILLDNIENKDSILVYGCGLQIIDNK
jgi:WD40 repeat protein